jgi:hypothetical protein
MDGLKWRGAVEGDSQDSLQKWKVQKREDKSLEFDVHSTRAQKSRRSHIIYIHQFYSIPSPFSKFTFTVVIEINSGTSIDPSPYSTRTSAIVSRSQAVSL